MISPQYVAIFGISPAGGAAQPFVITTNADNQAATDSGLVTASFNYGFDGVTWDRIRCGGVFGTLFSDITVGNLRTVAFGQVVNPLTGIFAPLTALDTVSDNIDLSFNNPAQLSLSALYGFNGSTVDRVRIAKIYKTVDATAAGLTALWTPTAGKKFRLMGYTISAAGTLAATGVNQIQLRDGAATVISRHNATMTITTPTGDTQIGSDLGQGYLSTTINNVLNVNLGSVVTNGTVAVNAWGTEE